MDDRHETLSVCECIQRIMTNHHLKLSTAESCTGGRIASSLTAVPGSSAYFIGSVVAYQNEVKERLLDVDSDDIDKYEVVSREVAISMVKGACRIFSSDYALASTGYAGPDGGTAKSPVGTIWLAYGTADNVETFCCTADHGRLANVENASATVLELFAEFLLSKYSNK